MIGNVIKPKSGNVEYPLVLTENEFIDVLNQGIYTYNLLGHRVTLNNSQNNSEGNPVWIIADVNHDSANTGQTNCYDLMAVGAVQTYRESFSGQSWRNSTTRTWLNSTYLNGFSSALQSHIINMKYNSNGSWYTDDKIILPSLKEMVGSSYQNMTFTEGEIYPVSVYPKRWANGNLSYCMLRTTENAGSRVWIIDNSPLSLITNDIGHLSPLFRVQ